MLRVSEEQERRLERAKLEEHLLIHLRAFAPRLVGPIGPENARKAVRLGWDRAAPHGLTNFGLLKFYLELMSCFGSHFDEDPLLPWAGELLRDPTRSDPAARCRKLHEAMTQYIERTCEPNRAIHLGALRRFREVQLERFKAADSGFEPQVLKALRWAHPERCEFLGDAALRGLIRRAPEVAAGCGVPNDLGITLVIGLAFVVGHGFATDPLHPWIEATLRNPEISSADKRAARLHRRTQIYLDNALKHLEQGESHV